MELQINHLVKTTRSASSNLAPPPLVTNNAKWNPAESFEKILQEQSPNPDEISGKFPIIEANGNGNQKLDIEDLDPQEEGATFLLPNGPDSSVKKVLMGEEMPLNPQLQNSENQRIGLFSPLQAKTQAILPTSKSVDEPSLAGRYPLPSSLPESLTEDLSAGLTRSMQSTQRLSQKSNLIMTQANFRGEDSGSLDQNTTDPGTGSLHLEQPVDHSGYSEKPNTQEELSSNSNKQQNFTEAPGQRAATDHEEIFVHANIQRDTKPFTIPQNTIPFTEKKIDLNGEINERKDTPHISSNSSSEIRTLTPQSQPIAHAKTVLPTPITNQIIETIQARMIAEKSIEITLNPSELGRLKLSLFPAENGLVVSLLAERSETLEVIKRNLGDLEQAFNEQGHEKIEFLFEQNDQSLNHDHQQNSETVLTKTNPVEENHLYPLEEAVVKRVITTTSGIDMRV